MPWNSTVSTYFQVLNVAGAISAFASASHSDIDFIKFLGLTGFVFSFTNVLLRLCHFDEQIPAWIYVEMGFNLLWTLLYIIGASLMAQWGSSYGCCGCSFAAFFGFTVTLVYITDLIVLFFKRKAMIEDSDEKSENPVSTKDAWKASNEKF